MEYIYFSLSLLFQPIHQWIWLKYIWKPDPLHQLPCWSKPLSYFSLGLFAVASLLVSLLPSLVNRVYSSHNSQNLIKMQIRSCHLLKPLQWLPISHQGKLKSLLWPKTLHDLGPNFSLNSDHIPYHCILCSLLSSDTGLHDRHTHPRTLALAVFSNWNIISLGVWMAHSNASFRSFFKYQLTKVFFSDNSR